MASVTVTDIPNTISPVNTEMWYRMTSPDTALENFRYYADLYYSPNPPATYTKIERYKILPQPGDFAGIFSPHKILKEYVKPIINPLTTGISAQSELSLAYYIKPGFGYNPKLTYGNKTTLDTGARRGIAINPLDYPDVITPAGFTFASGTYYYLRLETNNTSGGHGIQIGDFVTISKDIKGYNGYYDGQAEVINIGFTTTSANYNLIDLKILYSGDYTIAGSTVTPANYFESGAITDLIHVEPTATAGRYAWIGAGQYTERYTDWVTNWQVKPRFDYSPATYLNQHYLTDWDHSKNWKKIYIDQSETVSFLAQPGGLPTDQIRVRKYSTSGALYATDIINTTDITITGPLYFTLQAGIYNLYQTVYFDPVLFRYDISIGNNLHSTPGTFWSIAGKFELDQRDCLYTNRRLCWINKYGGYDYFNFTKQSSKETTVSRQEFQAQLKWNYQIGDRMQTVLSNDVTETFTINSNWLTEAENAFLEGLITSTDVYLIEETPYIYTGSGYTAPTLVKYPIVILDTSFKEKTNLRDKLFNMTVKYKLSHKPIMPTK